MSRRINDLRRALVAAASLYPLGQAFAQTPGLLPGTPLNPPASGQAPAPEQITPREQREILGNGTARMALILPPRNGDFVRIAQALRAGFLAAHQKDNRALACEIVEVPDNNQDYAEIYTELNTRGFEMIVGPLTRNGVNAIIDSQSPNVLTLALNFPDADRKIPGSMLNMGLAIEGEAKAAAAMAYDDAASRIPNRRPLRAVVVVGPGGLAKRAAQSLGEQWRELGGELANPIEVDARATGARASLLAANPDVVLIAASADVARNLRTQLPKNASGFATSLANPAATNPPTKASDMEGIRFTEMPMLVDGAPTAGYPRAPRGFTVELQRLYLLGIDAFRVAAELHTGKSRFDLEGVTGRIRVDRIEKRVDRVQSLAEVKNGQVVIAEER